MAVNKVEYGDQTLIDLTTDTVTESDVRGGVLFHRADGQLSVGSYRQDYNYVQNIDFTPDTSTARLQLEYDKKVSEEVVDTIIKDIPLATETCSGLMDVEDKYKVNCIADADAPFLATKHKDNNFTSSQTINGDLEVTGDIKSTTTDAHANNFSDAWSSTTLYKVGDYAIYENTLFKCLVQNTNVLPTNTTYWERTKVMDEITSLNNSLAESIEWKQIASVTGQTAITIPQNAKEIMVLVYYNGAHYINSFTTHFLTSSSRIINIDGWYHSASNYGLVNINATNTTITLRNAQANGQQYYTSATVIAYYR